MTTPWSTDYPLHWINLNRQLQRQRRMHWALKQGGWNANRWPAVDSEDSRQHFLPLPRLWQTGAALPGLQREEEAEPSRITNRAELACLSSWQTLVEQLEQDASPSGWFLLMEDDVGSSLACPEAWPLTLEQLINAVGSKALVIQLAAISSKARLSLHQQWHESNGAVLAVPKSRVRSHGNGAVLLHQRALPYLNRHIGRFLHQAHSQLHVLGHPRNVRPVADKWLYASLPASSCWVSTYPLFCLDASKSNLHNSHVERFHEPSRDNTLKIWQQDKASELIHCFDQWSAIL